MRGKWLPVALLFLWSCEGDFFPPGLYDYQVEQLLTGGEAKVWDLIVDSGTCSDSLKLYAVLIPSTIDDSVAISRLTPTADCASFDTLFIGNADASRFSDRLVFTDSLVFQDGQHWFINSITSTRLSIENSGIFNYQSR